MENDEERKQFPAFIIVLMIPLFWIIVYSFARRKRSLCIQQFGSSECRRSPLAHVVLAFAICLSFYGIVRIKVRSEAMKKYEHLS